MDRKFVFIRSAFVSQRKTARPRCSARLRDRGGPRSRKLRQRSIVQRMKITRQFRDICSYNKICALKDESASEKGAKKKGGGKIAKKRWDRKGKPRRHGPRRRGSFADKGRCSSSSRPVDLSADGVSLIHSMAHCYIRFIQLHPFIPLSFFLYELRHLAISNLSTHGGQSIWSRRRPLLGHHQPHDALRANPVLHQLRYSAGQLLVQQFRPR